MRTRLILGLFLCVVSVSPVFAESDWPTFRGPNFDGTIASERFTPEAGDLTVSWRAKGGAGYSGIAISNGIAVTAFTTGKDDVVAAFDSKSGKELWRHKLSAIYAGHDGSHDGPIATPAIDSGKVFALSAYGDFIAVDAASGKKLWAVSIPEKGGRKPFYGYTSSPVVTSGVVVIQMGGEKGKAIAGFDVANGSLKWSVGDDMVNYQSPILMKVDGKDRLIGVSDKKLFVIDPSNGSSILEYDHGGDDSAGALIPVPAGENKLLLRTKQDSADMVKLVSGADGKLTVEKVWSAGVFKNSYDTPVFHKGYLYGFNGRIYTCVDASNGQLKWRSRAVQDGFTMIVNDTIIIQTKDGKLHMAPASPEGWKENQQIALFQNISWTPPSFGDNAIFSRSHAEIARIDINPKSAAKTETQISPAIAGSSQFAALVKDLEKATDKKATVDAFFASQKSFPIVESGNQVTFLYRGEAEDVAITGDMIGLQQEEPMKRLPGTDVFYYSFTSSLEPDARINYRFIKNYEEPVADPLNSKATVDRRGGPLSWFAMSEWKEPAHLKEAPAEKKGKVESLEMKGKLEGASLKLDVYTPAGYDASKDKYPVVYFLDGPQARQHGLLENTLNNTIGNSVRPLIAVIVTEVKMPEGERLTVLEDTSQRAKFLVDELLPFIDSKYRTVADASGRAVFGTVQTGADAFVLASTYPQHFGSVATQSSWIMDVQSDVKAKLAKNKNLSIYMDWGKYDARSLSGGWDLRKANTEFFAYLKQNGFSPVGGETHEGYGWGAWRNRTDRVLKHLFPL